MNTVGREGQNREGQRFGRCFLFVGGLLWVQLLVTISVYNRISQPLEKPSKAFFETEVEGNAVDDNPSINVTTNLANTTALLEQRLGRLELELSSRNFHSSYQDDGNFIPFVIRDARRMVPTQIPKGFHIFDYINLEPSNRDQQETANSSLYHNGHYIDRAACQRYAVACYKRKILQVLDHLLNTTSATYYFYMESDNLLCIPLEQIRNLTYTHQRYFISTGIGFSGWIMRRDFVTDFYHAYVGRHKHHNEYPDPLGAKLLMEKKAWTVTRQYYVSHTTATVASDSGSRAEALTVGKSGSEKKHLPRCFEPRRGVWPISEENPRDMHGWDYFDYELCPDAEIFPCEPGQLEELTKDDPQVKVSDTLLLGRKGTLLQDNENARGMRGGVFGRRERLAERFGMRRHP